MAFAPSSLILANYYSPLSKALYVMRNNRKLLLQYLFVYPFYYVVAMFIATVILFFLMSWSQDYAIKFFYIMAGIMGIGSYFFHWRIGFYAISDILNSKQS